MNKRHIKMGLLAIERRATHIKYFSKKNKTNLLLHLFHFYKIPSKNRNLSNMKKKHINSYYRFHPDEK